MLFRVCAVRLQPAPAWRQKTTCQSRRVRSRNPFAGKRYRSQSRLSESEELRKLLARGAEPLASEKLRSKGRKSFVGSPWCPKQS